MSRSRGGWTLGGRMDVPRFPPPPAHEGAGFVAAATAAAAAVTDDPDVTPPPPVSRPVSRSSSSCERHAGSRGRRSRDTRGRKHLRNLVHPKKGLSRRRVTELRLRMTQSREEDDADVVCASDTPEPTRASYQKRAVNEDNGDHQQSSIATRSTAVQTASGIPYRLRVLPSLEDMLEDDCENPKKSSKICRHLRFLGRLAFSQFGLAWLLTLWAVAGAASFYATEGPREREQVAKLAGMQRELAIRLATELRQVKAEEPVFARKVQQYVAEHETLLLGAVSSGYGEGGGGGQVWTFPGCILFAVSLLTTLGFGAPVPRTTAGRMVAVGFAAIGIPAHFLLVLNIGILLAVRLQTFATTRKSISDNGEVPHSSKVPRWVKFVPFGSIGAYYLLGILCFGAARLRPFADSLLFPLDFTAAGGLAISSGPVRILYAIYLEGAVTIAAVAVAVLRVSASQSFTNIGLKYGLLTNT